MVQSPKCFMECPHKHGQVTEMLCGVPHKQCPVIEMHYRKTVWMESNLFLLSLVRCYYWDKVIFLCAMRLTGLKSPTNQPTNQPKPTNRVFFCLVPDDLASAGRGYSFFWRVMNVSRLSTSPSLLTDYRHC